MNNLTFDDIKTKVLPYFIAKYGDIRREAMTERMNKVEPFFIETLTSRKKNIELEKTVKMLELTLEFLASHDIAVPDNIKLKVMNNLSAKPLETVPGVSSLLTACFGENTFVYSPSKGVRNILSYAEKHTGNIPDIISTLAVLGVHIALEDLPTWFASPAAKPTIEKCRFLSNDMALLEKQYDDFANSHQSEIAKLNEFAKLESDIREEYYVRFLESVRGYMTPKDRELLNRYKNKEVSMKEFTDNSDLVQCIGKDLDANNRFQAFTEEAERQLRSPDTSEYIKSSIRADRIKFYNMIGAYDGTPEEDFLKSKIAEDCAPSDEVVKDIIDKKFKFSSEAKDEIIKKTSSYTEDKERLSHLNLMDQLEFSPKFYRNKKTACIMPSLKISNNSVTPIPILCYVMGNCLAGYRDVVLIHELVHAMELTFQGKNKKGDYCYKSGFEFLDTTEEMTESNAENAPRQNRKYELFSETVTQLIAIEITEEIHNDGIFLLDDPRLAKTREGTVYEQNALIAEPFWREFHDTILEARFDESLDVLYDAVGKSNFEAMNEIVQNFASIPYFKLLTAIQNGTPSPLVEKFTSLKKQSIDILTAMKTHSLSEKGKGTI